MNPLDYKIGVPDHWRASFNDLNGAHDDLVIALGLSVGMDQHGAPAKTIDYLKREPALQEIVVQRNAIRRRLTAR